MLQNQKSLSNIRENCLLATIQAQLQFIKRLRINNKSLLLLPS